MYPLYTAALNAPDVLLLCASEFVVGAYNLELLQSMPIGVQAYVLACHAFVSTMLTCLRVVVANVTHLLSNMLTCLYCSALQT